MQKRHVPSFTDDGVPGTERERVEALREQTLVYQRAGSVARAARQMRPKLTPAQKLTKLGFNLVFWVLVAALLLVMYSAVQAKREGRIPAVFGYMVLRVQTGSMVPTLPIGCYIVSRETDQPSAIEAGTIVTFRFTKGTVVTHRVIEVLTKEDGSVAYRTKGDNPLNDPDPEELTPDRVIGIYQFKLTLPTIWGSE